MKFTVLLLAVSSVWAIPTHQAHKACHRKGNFNQLCLDITDPGPSWQDDPYGCVYLPSFDCLDQHSVCEVQEDGFCDWTETQALVTCISSVENTLVEENEFVDVDEDTEAFVEDGCIRLGRQQEFCLNQDQAVSFVAPDYAHNWAFTCYDMFSSCKKQLHGQCGWTSSKLLKKCMDARKLWKPVPDDVEQDVQIL